jgi:hypothetical protein
MRVRKAYAVSLDDLRDPAIIHAPTAAKAKGRAMLNMVDCGYHERDIFRRLRCRRAPANDIALPDEHWLVAHLDAKDRQIIMHSYGADEFGHEGYRNHYCTDPGDRRLLRLAWEFGLFSGPSGEGAYGETPGYCGAFFRLTQLGREVARSMLPTYRRGDA